MADLSQLMRLRAASGRQATQSASIVEERRLTDADETRPSEADARPHRPRLPVLLLFATLSIVFVVSRVLFLDADLPDWSICRYSPFGEAFYTIASFNLFHYGTWTHQAVSFVMDDSSPMNIFQTLVTAATLTVFGNTYWGLRMAPFVAAALGYVFMGALLWRSVPSAGAEKALARGVGKMFVVGLWMTVGLFDFAFLVSARVNEPTVFRLCAICAVLFCCSLPYFNSGKKALGSLALGALTAGAVFFVYVYNLFLLPGVLVALCVWSMPAGLRNVGRQTLAFVSGGLIGTAAYFAFVWSIYRLGPRGWYNEWLGSHSELLPGFSLEKLWTVGTSNVLRLNAGLFVVALASLPLFVVALMHTRERVHVAIASALGFLLLQSSFANDYPEKKLLVLLPFVLVMAAVAQVRLVDMADRVPRLRRTLVAVGVVAIAVLITRAAQRFGGPLPHRFEALLAATEVGVCLLLVALAFCSVRNRRARVAISGLLAFCLIVPGASLAVRYVYGQPTFTYRDSMLAAAPYVNGRVTAGEKAYSMRLYNSSVPILSVYRSVTDPKYYRSSMRRLAREHISAGTFADTRPAVRAPLEAAGYVLAEEYDVPLRPPMKGFGRYVVP